MENNNGIDPVIQTKIDGLHKQLSLMLQRTHKLTAYLIVVSILIIITFYTMFSHISRNFSNEKEDLRAYKKELREDLGKAEAEPLLELFGLDGNPLTNQILSLKIEEKGEKYHLSIPYIVKNKGRKTADKMAVKFYSKRLPISSNFSTDEPNFKFEAFTYSDNIKPFEIPGGGFSLLWYYNISFNEKEKLFGKDSVLMKIYYGNNKIASAKFSILVRN